MNPFSGAFLLLCFYSAFFIVPFFLISFACWYVLKPKIQKFPPVIEVAISILSGGFVTFMFAVILQAVFGLVKDFP